MQFIGARPVVSLAEVVMLSLIAVLLLVPKLRRVDFATIGWGLLVRAFSGVPQVVLKVECNAELFVEFTFEASRTGWILETLFHYLR